MSRKTNIPHCGRSQKPWRESWNDRRTAHLGVGLKPPSTPALYRTRGRAAP
jgi:hypothetical protein